MNGDEMHANGLLHRRTDWLPIDVVLSTYKSYSGAGVYMVRQVEDQTVIYVGRGGDNRLIKRLGEYIAGHDLNGLGRALINAALNDVEWLRERLREVENGHVADAVEWMRASVTRESLQVCLLLTFTDQAAIDLEKELIQQHESTLWNAEVVRRRRIAPS